MSKRRHTILLACAAACLALLTGLTGGAAAQAAQPVYVGTWAELAAAAAAGKTEVIITADITRMGTEETVVFTAPVTLASAEGEQFTLNGTGKQILCIQGTDRAVRPEGLSVVENLIFENGDAQAFNADLYQSGSGGAVFVQGDLQAENCEFRYNKANIGGAVCVDGRLTMINCTIANNESVTGGGVCAYSGDMQLLGCAFTQNKAEYYGGGAYVYGGNLNASGLRVYRQRNPIRRGRVRLSRHGGRGGLHLLRTTARSTAAAACMPTSAP